MAARSVRNPFGGRREELRVLRQRSAENLLFAALVGGITGLWVSVLEWIVNDLIFDHVLRLDLWILALAPVIGLVISEIVRRYAGPRVSPSTADEYLHAFHDEHYDLGIRALVVRTVAGISTVGSGNAMGLEAPALYAGATIGSQLQRRLPRVFATTDRRTLMVAGAAAGVSAVFKAPATGAVFALEVPYRDDLARRMVLPALVSAAFSYLVFAAINGTTPLFAIVGNPVFRLADLLGALGLGVAAGLGARVFAKMVHIAKSMIATAPLPRHVIVGGSLVGLFVLCRLATGQNLSLSPGYNVIAWAIQPGHSFAVVMAVLAIRCAGSALGVAGGGAAGLFVPLVVGGTLIGRAAAGLIDPKNITLFSVIGAAAFLGAGYRVPLAAVMFVAETTGHPGFIVPGLIAAVAAELVMGTSSITSYQLDPQQLADLRGDST